MKRRTRSDSWERKAKSLANSLAMAIDYAENNSELTAVERARLRRCKTKLGIFREFENEKTSQN